jgi:hypothetical protein
VGRPERHSNTLRMEALNVIAVTQTQLNHGPRSNYEPAGLNELGFAFAWFKLASHWNWMYELMRS